MWIHKLILILGLFLIPYISVHSSTHNLSNVFVPNYGQLMDKEVLFYSNTENINIYFFKNKVSFVVKNSIRKNNSNDSILLFRFDMMMNGLSDNIKVGVASKSQERLNFYYPHISNGIRDVSAYRNLIYNDLKNGLILEFSFVDSKLKYEIKGNFEDNLSFEFLGINSISLDNPNSVIVKSEAGVLNLNLPDKSVTSIIEGNKIEFKSNNHPTQNRKSIKSEDKFLAGNLSWITYMGGSSFDHLYCIDADEKANLLLCGLTNSADFPTTVGSFQPQKAGGEDAIILKLDKDSKIDWCTFIGGSAADRAINIFKRDTVIWVSGESLSSDFPITANAHQQFNGGGSADILLMRLNERGHLIHATYHGGSSYDSSPDLAVDSKYNVWLVGRTFSNNFPVSSNAYYPNKGNFYDAFMISLDLNGNLRYSSFFPADQDVFGEGIAIDSMDNVCITGYTLSEKLPVTTGAYQSNKNQLYDAYLAKFTTLGKPIWITYFGGNGQDYGSNLTVDPYGNFFIFGFTNSTNLPTNNDVFQKQIKGAFDSFIAKFNNDGEFQWVSYFGGSNNEGIGESILYQIGGVKSDKYGNILISGQTKSSDMPLTKDAFQDNLKGTNDAFVAKFDVNGKLLYSTFIGGSSEDRGYDVVIDNEGYLVNVGWTSSSDFPVTENAFQKTYNGAIDAYIFRLKECTDFSEYELIIPNDTLNLASVDNQLPLMIKVNSGINVIDKLKIKLRFVEKYFDNIEFSNGIISNKYNNDKYVIYELQFDNLNIINANQVLTQIKFDSKIPSDFKTKIEIIDFDWSNDCTNTLLSESNLLSFCNSSIKTKILIKDTKTPLKQTVDIPLYLESNDLDKIFISYNNVLTIKYPTNRANLIKLTNGVILSKTSKAGFDECLIKINDIKIDKQSNIISYLTFEYKDLDTNRILIDISSVKWYEPCIVSELSGGYITKGCQEIQFSININESEVIANEIENQIPIYLNRISGSSKDVDLQFTEFSLNISQNIDIIKIDGFDIDNVIHENNSSKYILTKPKFSYSGNSQIIGFIKFRFNAHSKGNISLDFNDIRTDDECQKVNSDSFNLSILCDSVKLYISMADTSAAIGSIITRNIHFILNKKPVNIDTLNLFFKLKPLTKSIYINSISNVLKFTKEISEDNVEYHITKKIVTNPGRDSISIELLCLLDESTKGVINLTDFEVNYECLEIDLSQMKEITIEEACSESIRYIDLVKRTLVQVSPNPANNQISITVKSVDDGPVKLVISNLNGDRLSEYFWFKDSNTPQLIEKIYLNTEHLNSGLYIINLITTKQNYTEKLIISK